MFQRGCRGRNFIAKYSLVIGFTDVGCCLYCPAKSRQVTLCTETRRGICVHDDIISADRLYMYPGTHFISVGSKEIGSGTLFWTRQHAKKA